MFCPSVRQLRKKPTWLARRRRELINGGGPRQTRRLRRRSRRELELARKEEQSRMIITMSGMMTQVKTNHLYDKPFFF